MIGVAGALAQDDVKRILSFHIISQIGYMLMGLGLFTLAGIAGAIVFLVHHIPVKTVLFLVGGLIEEREGTSALDKIGGLAQRQPLLAVLFALPRSASPVSCRSRASSPSSRSSMPASRRWWCRSSSSPSPTASLPSCRW